MDEGSGGKAQRVPNPNIKIRGRIAMQHASRGETRWETNSRRRARSLSPEREQYRAHDRGEDREAGYGHNNDGNGGRRQKYRQRDYEDLNTTVNEHGYIEEEKPELEYRRASSRMPNLTATEQTANIFAKAPFGRSYRDDNSNRFDHSQSRDNKQSHRSTSMQSIATEREDDALLRDREIARGHNPGSGGKPTIGADANSDQQRSGQSMTEKSTSVRRFEDFIEFTCDHFEVTSPDHLVMGVKGTRENKFQQMFDVMTEYVADRFGTDKDGFLKPIHIIERFKLELFRNALLERDAVIADLRERLEETEARWDSVVQEQIEHDGDEGGADDGKTMVGESEGENKQNGEGEA